MPVAERLPHDHPLRIPLNNEVHARPPEELTAPLRLSYLAIFIDKEQGERNQQALLELARAHGAPLPDMHSSHYSANLGFMRIKWERHTEFMRYKFIVDGAESRPFAEPAVSVVPADFLAALDGETLVATHVVFAKPGPEPVDPDELSREFFNRSGLVGSQVAGGVGKAFTDFRIQADGFSRIYMEDHGLTQRQAGRTVQRLLEIDSYRMLSLLAFPLARQLAPHLSDSEKRLVEITTAMTAASGVDEPEMLDRLTKLQAEISSRHSDNDYRFSASAAYYSIVRSRIRELREERIAGLQTFSEFIERRLAPAMSTCEATARRQASLAERVGRATQLLSTRVDIARQTQNQALLESMDRRAKLSLRLQQTVEGLSVAAITYYIVSLVGYAAKGAERAGTISNPDLITAISIPVVALVIALAVRRARKVLTSPGEKLGDD